MMYIEWEIQTDSVVDSDMVRGFGVDGVLDSSLELRWDERLAERFALIRHILLRH